MNHNVKLEDPKTRINIVMDTVSEFTGFSKQDLLGRDQTAEVSLRRYVAWHLIRKLTGVTFEYIAEMFDNRHYSTIIHGIQKVEFLLTVNSYFKEELDRLTTRISNKIKDNE